VLRNPVVAAGAAANREPVISGGARLRPSRRAADVAGSATASSQPVRQVRAPGHRAAALGACAEEGSAHARGGKLRTSPSHETQPHQRRALHPNRERLAGLLPRQSLAIVNANDILPTNADGSLLMRQLRPLLSHRDRAGGDLLLLAPDAFDESQREILFIRQPTHTSDLEGHKLNQEDATRLSGSSRSSGCPISPPSFTS